MTITVKFFASLRETIGLDQNSVNISEVETIIDVWNQSTNGAEMPGNTLIAINMDYVAADHPVEDGDEVAFFPPVSGG